MLEARIEYRLKKEIEKLGGKCYKWRSPGNIGVPDRIVLMPNGKVFFIELKTVYKKPRPVQIKQMNALRELGFNVMVLDSIEEVQAFLDGVKG